MGILKYFLKYSWQKFVSMDVWMYEIQFVKF